MPAQRDSKATSEPRYSSFCGIDLDLFARDSTVHRRVLLLREFNVGDGTAVGGARLDDWMISLSFSRIAYPSAAPGGMLANALVLFVRLKR